MMTQTSELLQKELMEAGCNMEVSIQGVRQLIFKKHIIAKECVKCGELKRMEKFHKRRNGLGGRRADCRECKNAHTKEWREANVEKVAAYDEEVKERRAITTQAWRIRNVEQYKKGQSEWTRTNKDKRSLYAQQRTARKLALPYDMTNAELSNVAKSFGGSCVISEERNDIHLDHVIPLATGHGGTTRGNIVPLAASLNTSKNDAHLIEWYEANHKRFGIPRAKFDALIAYLAGANEMTTAEYHAYVDWCFDNPRVIDDSTGELVFRDGPINERNTYERKALI